MKFKFMTTALDKFAQMVGGAELKWSTQQGVVRMRYLHRKEVLEIDLDGEVRTLMMPLVEVVRKEHADGGDS